MVWWVDVQGGAGSGTYFNAFFVCFQFSFLKSGRIEVLGATARPSSWRCEQTTVLADIQKSSPAQYPPRHHQPNPSSGLFVSTTRLKPFAKPARLSSSTLAPSRLIALMPDISGSALGAEMTLDYPDACHCRRSGKISQVDHGRALLHLRRQRTSTISLATRLNSAGS